MRFMLPRFGTRSSRRQDQARKETRRNRLTQSRLSFECLEDRIVPTMQYLTLGDAAATIEFYGDFQATSTTAYSATGQDIQVGYPPEAGQEFEPVMIINGSVAFDQNVANTGGKAEFTVTGTILSAEFSQTLWTGSNQVFNVDQMVEGGFTLDKAATFAIGGIKFTINSIGFGPAPSAGSEYVPEVDLRGSLAFGFVTVAVNGDNYVYINSSGIGLTGAGISITDDVTLFGIDFKFEDVGLAYNSPSSEWLFFGTVQATIAGGSTLSVGLGTSEQNPGITVTNGDVTEVQGAVSGSFEIGGDDTGFIKFQSPVNNPLTLEWQGDDGNLWEISGTGQVIFNNAISASVTFGTQSQPGITIDNGEFSLDAFRISVGDINCGAFTLKSLIVGFQGSGDNLEIGGEVFVAIPGNWGINGSLVFDTHGINTILLDLTLGEEGIPIGPTGLFVVECSLGVENLDQPANLLIEGSITVDYGPQVAINGKTVSIIRTQGTVLIDKDEFQLTASVYFGGYTENEGTTNEQTKSIFGSGTGTLLLDWGSHNYKADVNVSLFDSTITFEASFSLDSQNDINIYVDASLNVPAGVPVIGGDHILGGTAVFRWFGSEKTGFCAAWVDIVGIDTGFEYDLAGYNGDSSDFHLIGNSTVNQIESGENPAPQVFNYYMSYDVPTGATAGTFSATWAAAGGTQTFYVTPPSGSQIQPTTTYNQNIILLSDYTTSTQFTARAVGSQDSIYTALNAGEYDLQLTSTVALTNVQFTASFSFPPPTAAVGDVPGASAELTIPVNLTGQVDSNYASQATYSVYLDNDQQNYDGVLLAKNLTFSAGAPTVFNWNLTNLLPLPYFLYAAIDDTVNQPVLTAYTAGTTPEPPLSGTIADPQQGGAALSGITVYIDLNNDGVYQPPSYDGSNNLLSGDYSTTTGATGFYAFYGPSPTTTFVNGTTYYVRTVVPFGYAFDANSATTNDASTAAFTYETGTFYDKNFAIDKLASLSGVVYSDNNQNGVQDSGENGISSQTLFLDLNSNGSFDLGEPSTTSASDGTYSFLNLTSGTTYTAYWSPNDAYYQTGPLPVPPGSFTATPASQYDQVVGDNFGLVPYVTISGTIYSVFPENDYQNAGFVTVNLFKDGRQVASTTANGGGYYQFNGLVPGNYSVAAALPAGNWVQQSSYQTSSTQTTLPTAGLPVTPPVGQPYNPTQFPYSVATGDFDRDGYTDYALLANVASSDGGDLSTAIRSTQVFVYYGSADGTTFTQFAYNTGLANPVQILALDFYQASRLDLAVLDANGTVNLLRYQSGRLFNQSGSVPAASGNPETVDLVAADMNADGRDDLVFSNYDASSDTTTLRVASILLSEVKSTTVPNNEGGQTVGRYRIAAGAIPLSTGQADSHSAVAMNSQNYGFTFVARTVGDGLFTFDQTGLGYESNAPGTAPLPIAIGPDGTIAYVSNQTQGEQYPGLRLQIYTQGGIWELVSSNLLGDSQQVVDLAGGLFSGNLRGDFAVLLVDDGDNGSAVQYFPISDFQTTGATVALPASVAPGFVQLLGRDVNGDGLTDLVIPNESAGTLQFLITTSPINQPQALSVAAGQASGSLNLYYDVVMPLQISGTVYTDTNGNSQQDAGETGVSGADVFLDLNGDGVFQSGLEPKAKTDSNGSYVFSSEHMSLSLNTPYPVAYTVTGDIGLTQAGSGPFLEYTATITNPFTPPSGLDFGQVASARITGSVSGYDYGAGAGANSVPLEGWTIQLFDGAQLIRTTQTNAAGDYTFEGLLPGAYTVRQVVPTGWRQVSPLGTSAVSGTIEKVPLSVTTNGATSSLSPTSVATGDFDNDGYLDVAYTSNSFDVFILFGSATGLSTTPVFFGVDGTEPIKLVALSFYQQGVLDIAVLGSENYLTVLRNQGGRQFQSTQIKLSSSLFVIATNMVAGDFDNDGLDDLALGCPSNQNAFAVILGKDQSIHVTYGPQYEGPNGTKMGLAVGDMNGDGNLDLIAYDQSGLQFNLLLGNGSGGFTVTNPSIPPPFSVEGTYQIGSSVAVGEFNPGQGLQVAMAWAYYSLYDPAYIGFANATQSEGGAWSTTNGVLGTYIVPGSGGYPPSGQITGIPDAIAADFNGDGRPDLITLQTGSGTSTFGGTDGITGVQIFVDGRAFPGTPTLLSLLDAYVPFEGALKGPQQLVAGDINGDGLLDLIIPNYNSAELEILINTSIFSLTGYDVEITSTKNIGDINFTNVSFASITGSVTADSNRNGRLEPVDAGRAGVQVYLDLNHNGQLDSGEPTALTNSAGLFAFSGLADGTYDVRLANESGWVVTTAGNGALQAQVGAGQSPAFLQFSTAARLFTAVENQIVSEEQVLDVALGLNSTAAGRHMTFQLVNPPAGASIDAGTGHFTWTPSLGQSPGATTITVRAFDLLDPTFQDTLSFQVQVNAVPSTEHFLIHLYQQLLQRSPDAAGLASWTAVLNGGAARSLVVSLFWTSIEHRGIQVDSYYVNYLNRTADAAGRESWVAALDAGTPEAEVQFQFLDSAEYQARWANDASFVSGLYQDVLHRAPDSGGAAFWESVAASNDGHAQVISGLLGSAERFQTETDLLYRELLARPASTEDLAYWLAQIEQHQADLPGIEQFVLASEEYYQRT